MALFSDRFINPLLIALATGLVLGLVMSRAGNVTLPGGALRHSTEYTLRQPEKKVGVVEDRRVDRKRKSIVGGYPASKKPWRLAEFLRNRRCYTRPPASNRPIEPRAPM